MKAELITHMGDDLLVVNAARVSFDKESEYDVYGLDVYGNRVYLKPEEVDNHLEDMCTKKIKERDKKLLSYLAKHQHWTPFSHPQICMRETVPIFVARQRFKHMVGFTYNEVSRRYVDDEPEFYTPDVWRSRPEGSVKQGSGVGVVTEVIDPWDLDCTISPDDLYGGAVEGCREAYDYLLKAGVAPEQARMVLPQSMYTSYYVTGSLAAWARAYKQRIESTAQIEIQELAKQWDEVIKPLFPESWAVLTGGNDNGRAN